MLLLGCFLDEVHNALPVNIDHLQEVKRIYIPVHGEALALVELQWGIKQPVELFRVEVVLFI